MKRRKELVLFTAMLLAGCLIRSINIRQPLLEYNATRQVQTAMIVRNFAFGGFRFLYPEIDDQGKGPTYLMQEFPIITAPLSIICALLNDIPEWLLRFSSVVFFAFSAVILYLLAESFCGVSVALMASAIFIFSPLSILMGRVFQPDMPMVFFVLLCLFKAKRWTQTDRWSDFFLSAAGLTGAVLLKVTNLYIIIPLYYLFWAGKKQGKNFYAKTFLFALISCVPLLWWWGIHAPQVRMRYPNAYDTFSSRYILESAFHYLKSPAFYLEIASHIVKTALTPFVFLAFVYGVLKGLTERGKGFFNSWLAAVVFFFLAVPEQSKQEYYMLSLLPVAAIFAAAAIARIYSVLEKRSLYRVSFFAAAFFSAAFSGYLVYPKFITTPLHRDIVAAGRAVDNSVPKDSLVVASHGYGPDFLYYCKRKGWPFLIERQGLLEYFMAVKTSVSKNAMSAFLYPEADLLRLQREGAGYFAIVGTKELDKEPAFKSYLSGLQLIALQEPHYAVYKLK